MSVPDAGALRPAVYRHNGARRHLVLLGAEVGQGFGDIFGFDPILVFGLWHRLAIRLGVDRARRDRIHQDVIVEYFLGERRGKRPDRALGDRICRVIAGAKQARP